MPILTLRRRRPNPPRIITWVHKNPKWRKPFPRLPCPKSSSHHRVSFYLIGRLKIEFRPIRWLGFKRPATSPATRECIFRIQFSELKSKVNLEFLTLNGKVCFSLDLGLNMNTSGNELGFLDQIVSPVNQVNSNNQPVSETLPVPVKKFKFLPNFPGRRFQPSAPTPRTHSGAKPGPVKCTRG